MMSGEVEETWEFYEENAWRYIEKTKTGSNRFLLNSQDPKLPIRSGVGECR